MNTDLRLRSLSLSILSMLCVGAAVSCSGGNSTVAGAGGGPILATGSKGGSSGTGGTAATGTNTGASTGTGATGTSTNTGVTGSTGTGSTPVAGTGSGVGTEAEGTANVHNCPLPNYFDQQDAMITDFKDPSCSGTGLCYGSGGGVVGTMSAPAYACGGSLTATPDPEGMVIKGTITGPTTFHFSFQPCAYVHGYNSIQSLMINRLADPALSIAVAMNTIASSPPAKGGTCADATCTDPSFVKNIPGRSGGSENVITWPFDKMTPDIGYFRNQIVGIDMTLAPTTPCGTSTPVDLTIEHVFFYAAPI